MKSMRKLSRQVYIISDLHLGGVYPDTDKPGARGFRLCTQVQALADFINALAQKPPGRPKIELIINGDFMDFLAEKEPVFPYWNPFTSDTEAAIRKLEAIVQRDRLVFDSLRRLLERGHRLVIVLGNHDVELSLFQVRRRFMSILGVEGRHDFEFVYDGEAYIVGDALVEHGNRYDKFNIVDFDGLRRVRSLLSRRQQVPEKYAFNPPPGSRIVSTIINQIKEVYPLCRSSQA